MRKDQDFRLPGSMPSDISQAHQIRPHEGFRQQEIRRRAEPKFKTAGPATAFLAAPPEWTKHGLCVDRDLLFDDPDARTFHTTVKPLCEACPVKDICLSSALEEEGDEGPAFRSGVRGGLRPRERARLAQVRPDRPAACSKGHSMSGEGEAYWNADRRHWACAECKRQRALRQRAAREENVA